MNEPMPRHILTAKPRGKVNWGFLCVLIYYGVSLAFVCWLGTYIVDAYQRGNPAFVDAKNKIERYVSGNFR